MADVADSEVSVKQVTENITEDVYENNLVFFAIDRKDRLDEDVNYAVRLDLYVEVDKEMSTTCSRGHVIYGNNVAVIEAVLVLETCITMEDN